MNKRFFTPLLKFGLEQEEIFEDSQNSVAVKITANWIDTIMYFYDGYFTISSPNNKYCIYHGIAPSLTGYEFIPLNTIIQLQTDGAYFDGVKPIQPIWDFDVVSSAWREFTFTSKIKGIPLEEPIGYGNYSGIEVSIKTIQFGESSTIRPKENIKIDSSAVKDLSGRFHVKIKKQDVIFQNGFIKINHFENLSKNRNIKIVSFSAKFANGIVDLKPIVNYPYCETNSVGSFNGFYLRDEDFLLREDVDFEYVELFYNVEILTDNSERYNFRKTFLGKNVISDHTDGTEAHAISLKNMFNAIYPEFTGVYHDSIFDSRTGFGNVTPRFLPKYASETDSDIIFRAIVDGASYRDIASNPNLICVAAHFNNDFVRRDITSSEKEFLNTIAVNSCIKNGTPGPGTCTSFGDGVEFTEDLTLLSQTFPAFDIAWINPIYQESAACVAVTVKLKKIKEATGASWSIIRKACRATASNNGVWDMYRGFGIINMQAAIDYINTNYKNNLTYRAELADKLESDRGIPADLQYSDLLPNSPVSKKMIDEIEAGKIQRAVLEKTFVWDGNPYVVYSDQEGFPFNQISVKSVQSFQINYSYKDTVNYYQYQDKTSNMISGNLDENTPANWFINPTNWGQAIGTEFTIKILVDYIL